jgi:hypothetical protein
MRVYPLLTFGALLVLGGTPSLAGRAVTDDERAKLVAAVAAQGCSGGRQYPRRYLWLAWEQVRRRRSRAALSQVRCYARPKVFAARTGENEARLEGRLY